MALDRKLLNGFRAEQTARWPGGRQIVVVVDFGSIQQHEIVLRPVAGKRDEFAIAKLDGALPPVINQSHTGIEQHQLI
jgi:hypothetical protein